jgi:hypothetical protein
MSIFNRYEPSRKLKSRLEAEFGIEFANNKLKKVNDMGNNFYVGKKGEINFVPINTGEPVMPFAFFNKKKQLVIGNQTNFQQITNLDEILLQMTNAYKLAFQKGYIFNPYEFLLKLNKDEAEHGDQYYNGKAQLAFSNQVPQNHVLKPEAIEKMKSYSINDFLDHFIGWNFGVSAHRSPELKSALTSLNTEIFESGKRIYAGTGLNVVGTYQAHNGLQHYKFPTELGD